MSLVGQSRRLSDVGTSSFTPNYGPIAATQQGRRFGPASNCTLLEAGQTQRLRVDLESGPISIHRFGDDNRPPRSDNLHNFRRNTS